jgi:hypothetical protein
MNMMNIADARFLRLIGCFRKLLDFGLTWRRRSASGEPKRETAEYGSNAHEV